MNKIVLFLDMPELNNEAVAGMQKFLHEVTRVFEEHYLKQLRQYYEELYYKDQALDDLEDLY